MPHTGRRIATAAIGLLLVGIASTAVLGGTSVIDPARRTAPAEASPSAADLELINRAVDAVNATAGGDPASQRAVLQELVVPVRAADQRSCEPAKTTVRFVPVWTALRADPNGVAHSYVLPALIRSYTDGRVTGTDTAALIISVAGGSAHLPPLCVA
jgi:hypothetical protein